MSAYQQPDVGVFQYAGTDMYAYFTGTGSNSQFTLGWDYTGSISSGDHDYVYVRQTGTWESVAGRWNDQTHIMRVDISTYGTNVGWGLQSRNDVEGQPSGAQVTELLVRYPFITSLAVSVSDASNLLIEWTTSVTEPPGFGRFRLYSDSGGLPYHIVGSFDPEERGSTMSNPAGYSALDTFYMVAVDTDNKTLSFPSDTVNVV